MKYRQTKGKVKFEVEFVVEAQVENKEQMAALVDNAKSAIINAVKLPKRVKVEGAKVYID